MTYASEAPRYRAETDKPVHHLTVADARGEAMGYLWANDEDDAAGWCLRPAGDRAGFGEGLEWSARLNTAKARGLLPTAALAELARDSDPRRVSHVVPDSLTTAPTLAALKELARVVTEADDRRLLAQLDRENADSWHELGGALAALTDEDRAVRWSGGGQRPDGARRMSYPLHSERLQRLVHALSAVGAVTPAYLWQDNPPTGGWVRRTRCARPRPWCAGNGSPTGRSPRRWRAVFSTPWPSRCALGTRAWPTVGGTIPDACGMRIGRARSCRNLGCTACSPMPYVAGVN